MDARSALLPENRRTARDAANAAAVLANPTAPPPAAAGDATCAYVKDWRSGSAAPRKTKVSLRAAGTATLSGASYVGYNAAAGIWEVFQAVNGGSNVSLTATRGFGEVLDDVAARYTHVSVVGTLSASTLTAEVEPMEVTR
jgi:hypothetical protein